MNHWTFIAAAYGATIVSTIALLVWSFAAMRRAEAQAETIAR